MISQAAQLYSTYSWGGPLFIYQGRDQGTNTSSTEDFFGFVAHNFSRKPSFGAFRRAPGH
jgi:hypothetical protein